MLGGSCVCMRACVSVCLCTCKHILHVCGYMCFKVCACVYRCKSTRLGLVIILNSSPIFFSEVKGSHNQTQSSLLRLVSVSLLWDPISAF